MGENVAGFGGDIWLVRHGESHANKSGELVGRRDIELTETGRHQAKAAAKFLSGRVDRPAIVVSSPLVRASETARLIGEGLDADVELDERLIELDYGDLEGSAFSDLLDDWPPRWVADPECAVPGGESYAQLEVRSEAAVDDAEHVATRAGNATLVVVAHLGVVKALVKRALQATPLLYEHLLVGHGSLTCLAPGDPRHYVRCLNVEPALR